MYSQLNENKPLKLNLTYNADVKYASTANVDNNALQQLNSSMKRLSTYRVLKLKNSTSGTSSTMNGRIERYFSLVSLVI